MDSRVCPPLTAATPSRPSSIPQPVVGHHRRNHFQLQLCSRPLSPPPLPQRHPFLLLLLDQAMPPPPGPGTASLPPYPTTATGIYSITLLYHIQHTTGQCTMSLPFSLLYPIIQLLTTGVPLPTLRWMFRLGRHLKCPPRAP